MFYKKIIGTAILLMLLLGTSLVAYSFVNACVGAEGSSIFEGVVLSRTEDRIKLAPLGAEAVVLSVNAETNCAGSCLVETGDRLRVMARESGGVTVATALKRVDNGSGYGME